MLALSRREGETIVITVGDTTMQVHVSTIGPRHVIMAFDAPREVTVDRLEVAKKKEKDHA